MQKTKLLIAFLILSLIFVTSCGRGTSENQRAFYYWKTNFSLTAFEKQKLASLEIRKLYIRLFDVDWAPEINDIIPVGEIRFSEQPPAKTEIIPTVFITNRAMQNLKPQAVEVSARKILSQMEGICQKNHLTFSEVQLDCDWSDATRITYFTLLGYVKNYLHAQHKQLSATIRLHQVKYAKRTGVPPVDRGMLMFYNMGKLEASTQKNAIYNKNDAGLYIEYLKNYKLPLDAALPIFSQILQIREQRIVDLINKSFMQDISTDARFRKLPNGTYIVESSFFLHGIYFMKDDVLHIETLTGDELLDASENLASHLNRTKRTITLFDLDSLNLRNFNEKDIHQTFHYFD